MIDDYEDFDIADIEELMQYDTPQEPEKTPSGFRVCTDVLSEINELCKRDSFTVTPNTVYRITRLHYDNQHLYIFLTGVGNVQFYCKIFCPIYSYRLCTTKNHKTQKCRDTKCSSYKNMVVTGLKNDVCELVYVVKVPRTLANANVKFLLDEFCNDVNRVQMQYTLYEGDCIKFITNVTVDNMGCCQNVCMSDIATVPIDELTESIDSIVASYDLETYTNGFQLSNADTDPIITIALTVKRHNNQLLRYCLINSRQQPDLTDPYTQVDNVDGEAVVVPFNNERDMIVTFYKMLTITNPDEIIDYNGDNFDLPYLIKRAKILCIDSNIIRRYDLPLTTFKVYKINTKFGYGFNSHSMVYYNHVDLYQYIKNTLDASKMENMKLDTVANFYLGVGKVELSVKEMMQLYKQGKFGKIVKYNIRDTVLPVDIFNKCQVANRLYADCSIMSLSRDDYLKRISHRIIVALFDRALKNRNTNDESDPYFLNKFDLNKMTPRKPTFQAVDSDSDCDDKKDEGDPMDLTTLLRERVPEHKIPGNAVKLCPLKCNIKYTGGMVLSPVPGYYGLTFTLDFSQLYTSIMIAESACLSNLFYGSDGYLYLQKNKNAITTKFLQEQAGKRAEWKAEMKKYPNNSFMYFLFDSWQNAAKLNCNSQYGWFGLFCKALANHITFIGRQNLADAKAKIENLSNDKTIMKKWNLTEMTLKVVYGDTDSTFVNIKLNEQELHSMGDAKLRQMILEDIVKPVNDGWCGDYKMELENIMRCMLIKGKKSYVCLKENGSVYKRGFNVKKDVPLFLRAIFDQVIEKVLKNHSLDCVLQHLVDQLKQQCDEFCTDARDKYSFSQTLNVNVKTTIAYKLYMELKASPDTKLLHDSGDRIPYLLLDIKSANVKDKAWPTQLFTDKHTLSWSKHLSIICSFLNDLMSMLNNDTAFVYAFEQICTYLQKNQCNDIVWPTLKRLTDAKKKDLLKRELNLKDKKLITQDMYDTILQEKSHKYIHEYEFTMSKVKPMYSIPKTSFCDDCPTCNGRGESAVLRCQSIDLVPAEKKAKPKTSRPQKKAFANVKSESTSELAFKRKLSNSEAKGIKKAFTVIKRSN
ncbi:DNA polymerase [Trichoplusia ni granulovirus LBIV-12]|uniref:DNA polymerase n=1 Tax=Trichoplusia ni granulovirus LBIV-12 TaxID=1916701 RepID=A0A1D8QLG1_GVTN|nr:DNA polymerase [Trichoplusia ni granulovirus LBIV-12]AOW41466.1 DNA polymerase [Trichoplusia ni granulovirus LBIV-12]